MDARKAFAVAVLAEVWAGANLPEDLIAIAEAIRSEMKSAGLWERA